MNSIELEDIVSQIDHIGLDMYQLMTELFPICRSITGNGVRDTLILKFMKYRVALLSLIGLFQKNGI